MNCNEYRERLGTAQDAHLPPSAELATHGTSCAAPECRLLWEEHLLIQTFVTSVPRVESPELVDRVLAAVSTDRRPTIERSWSEPLPRRRASAWLSMTTVAGVLVAAVLALSPARKPPQVVQAPPKPAKIVDESEPLAMLPMHLAARAPSLVTDTMNGRFSAKSIEELPIVSPLVSTVSETLKPMGQELKDWVEQFQAGVDEMDSTQIAAPATPVT
jgi:hypothetical protein